MTMKVRFGGENIKIYQNENVALFNGDCLEIMQDIPDSTVDMILCDLHIVTGKQIGRAHV